MILALVLASAIETAVTLPSASSPALTIELRDAENPNLRYSIARIPEPPGQFVSTDEGNIVENR